MNTTMVIKIITCEFFIDFTYRIFVTRTFQRRLEIVSPMAWESHIKSELKPTGLLLNRHHKTTEDSFQGWGRC